MRGFFFASAIVALLAFVVGCGGKSASSGGGASDKDAGAKEGASVRKPPTEVTLTEGGVAEIDRAAKETKNAVVLVEFWTMASEPPSSLALVSDTRGGDGQVRGKSLSKDQVAWHGVRKAEYLGMRYDEFFLRVVLVNVDGAEKKDEVLTYLKEHDARHVTNILWKGDPATATSKYGFTGKAPHQALFGRDGNRIWATGEPTKGTMDDLIFHAIDK